MLVNSRPPERNNPDYNSEAALKEAKAKYPLERVIEGYGFGPKDGGSMKCFPCPFCNKKKAGIHHQAGDPLFKCFSTSCPSEAKSMGPVEFIMLKENYGRKDAFTSYLKMAGVWKERTRFKAPQSEVQTPKPKVQSAPEPPPGLDEDAPPDGSDENVSALFESAEQATLPQSGVETEPQSVEKRSSTGAELGPPPAPEPASPPSQASPSEDPPKLSPQEREEQDARLAKLFHPPAAPTISPSPNASVSGATPPTKSKDALPLEPHGALSASAPNFSSPPAEPLETGFSNPVLPPGTALPAVDGPTVLRPGNVEEVDFGTRLDDPLQTLRFFYDALELSESDEAAIWTNRGLESRTITALGFRSNAKANRELLQSMEAKFSDQALLKSGLWRKARSGRGEIKPNAQFYGYGRVRKLTPQEMRERKPGDDGEFLWGWNEPVLIPYFDEKGALICLRPHKGMGSSGTVVGTPNLYVPRDTGKTGAGRREKFYNVVITEGEFKAAALWQMVGGGRDDGRDPWGVAALPGITMAKNYELREGLNFWLWAVGAKHVVVAYDNEEKGDPKLPSFKEDKRKRYDSTIWSRYLATDVAQKMHIRGEVCVLPNAWRDKTGKADWDGTLAQMVHTK